MEEEKEEEEECSIQAYVRCSTAKWSGTAADVEQMLSVNAPWKT